MSISSILTKHCPKYETIIPSSGTKVWFRPFLVKEEKKLLIVQEFGTEKEIIKCMVEILESCFDSNIFGSLPLFDIEYLFLQLRSKSISSVVFSVLTCPYTKENIKISINLDEIVLTTDKNHTKKLNLGNRITLNMKYPSVDMLLESDINVSSESIYNVALNCMESIQTQDELISCKEQTKEELEDFLNNMSIEQFSKITQFFETIPKLEKTIEYKTKDSIDRKLLLRGIKDFFV